jgi:hypothetical protein
MAIHNIHFLIDPDADPVNQVQATRKDSMSRHIVEREKKKYVFGWDQHLMSFFLQIHDLTLDEDDEDRIDYAIGATANTIVYEVDEFVKVARRYGLDIPYKTRVELYGEKDDGI